jgi:hypothetical protein
VQTRRIVLTNLSHFEKYLLTVIVGLSSGISWITFILWNRLIRERFPKDLTLDQIYSLRFYIVLYLCICLMIWTIFYGYKVQQQYLGNPIKGGLIRFGFLNLFVYLETRELQKTGKSLFNKESVATDSLFRRVYKGVINFLCNVINFFYNYIVNSPMFLWGYFRLNGPLYFINPLRNLCYNLGNWTYPFFNKDMSKDKYVFRATICITIFIYLPRVIAFSVFLFEISVNKRLDYFYSVAVILLIPYIYKSIRQIALDFGIYDTVELQENPGLLILLSKDLAEYKLFVIQQNYTQLIRDLEAAEQLLNKDKSIKYFMFKNGPVFSDEHFRIAKNTYFYAERLESSMWVLYETEGEYSNIQKFLISLLLAISFGIWLLIILQLY